MFQKQEIMDLGGFDKKNVCEDMEIIVRIHKERRLKKKPYTVRFITDPICWTEVPRHSASSANSAADGIWD